MVRTVVVDIDGVIATEGKTKVYSDEAGWCYGKCAAIPEGVDMVRRLYADGVRVVFHTARPAHDRNVTESWLRRKKIPYHALIMGKPLAAMYLDDCSFPAFDPKTCAGEVMAELLRRTS